MQKTEERKVYTRIFKEGPFNLAVPQGIPSTFKALFSEMLKTKIMPDFSEDTGLYIFSDFCGESKEAGFNTYSFLICSANKGAVFQDAMKKIRERHNILFSEEEIAWKKLGLGVGSRKLKKAIPDILTAYNSYIHGILFTVSVDKNITSIFGENKKVTHKDLIDIMGGHGFSTLKGNQMEKLLIICHSLAMIMSMVAFNGQKFLWYCDNDDINTNEKIFEDTRKIFSQILPIYSSNEYAILGFAKSFNKCYKMNDFLSLTDLTAGAIQEVLTSTLKINVEESEFSKERAEVIKWLGMESGHLTKVHLILTTEDGKNISSRQVKIDAKI